MERDKIYEKELLKFLAKAIEVNPKLSMAVFNELPNRIATERVYRRFFGTWNNAKKLAGELLPPVSDTDKRDFTVDRLKKTIVNLRKENVKLYKKQLTLADVREQIFDLKEAPITMPDWLLRPVYFMPKGNKVTTHGVPTLLLSDFHLGEVVNSKQVFGVNEFNMTIAEQRIRELADRVVGILKHHLKGNHPGLVLLLNGDFVSGCIHEELLITNEKPIMPIVIRAYELLAWFIQTMQKHFGQVQLFCCHGNHSRTFKKPIYKESALSSYDWLIYTLLDRYFENDKNVNFIISPGDDIQFKIYNHHYRMTHGGQFRGGQGFLGHIAPVTRGEIRKRSAAESYGQNYDTLIVGHFHSYGLFKRVICNGSLIGYSEYSMNNNYPYERPQQALWFTHPENGITFSCPIFCTEEKQPEKSKWVSWRK
jgi:predicted phosphodiesterase